jgi:hypothetical protein
VGEIIFQEKRERTLEEKDMVTGYPLKVDFLNGRVCVTTDLNRPAVFNITKPYFTLDVIRWCAWRWRLMRRAGSTRSTAGRQCLDMNPWLHSWFFSFLVVLLIVGLLTGLAALVYAVLYRIWGHEDREEIREVLGKSNEEARVKKPTTTKAA